MQIQWFPGHMAKTRRLITDSLKLVDVVIELVDARLPLSSRNPEIDRIVGSRPRVLVLNKADIADSDANARWLSFFEKKGLAVILADSQSGKGLKNLDAAIEKVLAEKLERERQKGMQRRAIKMLVVGIPNVGKSSFINRLSGRVAAKTGDRPGVTTAKQWIKVAGKYEILDTPGILWPKFEDPEVGRRIAFTGGIKDEIMDIEELAFFLVGYLRQNYRELLEERYKITEDTESLDDFELLELIGKKRGCIVSGGNIDTLRASNLILDEFRAAKIGKITLELPNK
ncbi:MAG: ribosome biogenesis GTPase YlqF [Ruminococcaceae bacterium]|nr:ribosome biogenesis GTPase YlqF [Oscillospiraceae bacterium]